MAGSRENAPIRPGALSALLRELVAPGTAPGGWEGALRPSIVVGRFEMVRELGRGGFGIVWEARDRELKRAVAFKAVAGADHRGFREERLLREAESAARLSHPNIVTLYDVGRSEHGPYLVFELLRGQTLAERVEQGSIPVWEGLRIAVEVARGLAHAHGQGVVHRDLTPGNVFLCADGQVKLLDLGLAHAFGHRKVEGGTPSYMAPEQRRGAPEDERTDIFALGVILFQMLSGRLPFRPGEDDRTPADALEVREAPALGRLLARMLELDPVLRPRHAGELLPLLEGFAGELRRAPSSAPEVAVRSGGAAASVAVLPFADLSATRDQDWLCDGIAEEILNALASVCRLKVASRSSSFQFKGKAFDGRDIARALGVTTLLEGSVRKAGERVRITARLVDGRDGYELWSRSFDRGLEDVFAIQEEIAGAVVGALEVRLSSEEANRLQRGGTRHPQAFEMYLRARQFLRQQFDSGYRFARQLFKGAIELDPEFAQAHAGLADTSFMLLQWQLITDNVDAVRAEALAASETALRLDPELAEAHVARANLLTIAGRDAEGEEGFRRGLALNPKLWHAWYFYARFLFAEGRLAEAAHSFAEAARCDPDDYNALALLAEAYQVLGDERALATARRAFELLERRMRLNPEDGRAIYLAGGLAIRMGDRARALELVARALELYPNDFGTLYNVACTYALAGETDRALDLIDRAVATGRGFRAWMEHDADFDPLRSNPRFAEILARLRQ